MSDETTQDTQNDAPKEEGTGTDQDTQESTESTDETLETWDEERAKAALTKKNNEAKNLRERLKAAEEKAAKWAEHERSQMSDKQKLEEELKARDERYAALSRERNTFAIQKAYPVLTDDLIDLLPLDADFETLETKAKALAEVITKASKAEPDKKVIESRDLSNADTDGEGGTFDPSKLAAKYAPRT